MPRSVEEILARSEEYADRFENYEPQPGDLSESLDLVAIRSAVHLRSAAERAVLEAVRLARLHAASWRVIGFELGTTGEAARQKYAELIK